MNKRSLPLFVVLLMISAIWIVFDQHGKINNDGVLYLRQANLFALGDVEAAKALYPWPFFGFIIAKLHQLTNISLQECAQIINIFAFTIAGYFFLKTLSLLSKDYLVLLSGFLTLITSIPILDDYMPMLMRDNGMWAGFMAGLYFYLRWYQNPTYMDATLMQFSFLIGALFRPELLIFNTLIPVTSFWLKSNQIGRIKAAWMTGFMVLLGGLVLTWFLLYQYFIGDFSSHNAGRLIELYERPKSVLVNLFSPLPMKTTTDNYYLLRLIEDYPLGLKYAFITYVVMYKWIAIVGFMHLVTAYIAIKKGLFPAESTRPILLIFLLSFAITAINLPTNYVLSARYWVMNLWVVYLASSLGLLYLIRQLGTLKNIYSTIGKTLLGILLISYTLVVLFDSHHKTTDMEAVDWIKEHQLDLDHTYIDNPRLCFYLGRFDCESIGLENAKKEKYPYLIFHLNRYQTYGEIKGYELVKKILEKNNKPTFVIYKKTES